MNRNMARPRIPRLEWWLIAAVILFGALVGLLPDAIAIIK
jgi:hypothetical protein